ncbi:CGNR zinc finger domain-containing protein [Streptomyces sp. JNUCC 63]
MSRNTWGDRPRPSAPVPGQTPAGTALAQLGIAWTEVVPTGQVQRPKRCAEHTCIGVFRDASKDRSRRRCSMRVCGDRTNSRRYTARRRAITAG